MAVVTLFESDRCRWFAAHPHPAGRTGEVTREDLKIIGQREKPLVQARIQIRGTPKQLEYKICVHPVVAVDLNRRRKP